MESHTSLNNGASPSTQVQVTNMRSPTELNRKHYHFRSQLRLENVAISQKIGFQIRSFLSHSGPQREALMENVRGLMSNNTSTSGEKEDLSLVSFRDKILLAAAAATTASTNSIVVPQPPPGATTIAKAAMISAGQHPQSGVATTKSDIFSSPAIRQFQQNNNNNNNKPYLHNSNNDETVKSKSLLKQRTHNQQVHSLHTSETIESTHNNNNNNNFNTSSFLTAKSMLSPNGVSNAFTSNHPIFFQNQQKQLQFQKKNARNSNPAVFLDNEGSSGAKTTREMVQHSPSYYKINHNSSTQGASQTTAGNKVSATTSFQHKRIEGGTSVIEQRNPFADIFSPSYLQRELEVNKKPGSISTQSLYTVRQRGKDLPPLMQQRSEATHPNQPYHSEKNPVKQTLNASSSSQNNSSSTNNNSASMMHSSSKINSIIALTPFKKHQTSITSPSVTKSSTTTMITASDSIRQSSTQLPSTDALITLPNSPIPHNHLTTISNNHNNQQEIPSAVIYNNNNNKNNNNNNNNNLSKLLQPQQQSNVLLPMKIEADVKHMNANFANFKTIFANKIKATTDFFLDRVTTTSETYLNGNINGMNNKDNQRINNHQSLRINCFSNFIITIIESILQTPSLLQFDAAGQLTQSSQSQQLPQQNQQQGVFPQVSIPKQVLSFEITEEVLSQLSRILLESFHSAYSQQLSTFSRIIDHFLVYCRRHIVQKSLISLISPAVFSDILTVAQQEYQQLVQELQQQSKENPSTQVQLKQSLPITTLFDFAVAVLSEDATAIAMQLKATSIKSKVTPTLLFIAKLALQKALEHSNLEGKILEKFERLRHILFPAMCFAQPSVMSRIKDTLNSNKRLLLILVKSKDSVSQAEQLQMQQVRLSLPNTILQTFSGSKGISTLASILLRYSGEIEQGNIGKQVAYAIESAFSEAVEKSSEAHIELQLKDIHFKMYFLQKLRELDIIGQVFADLKTIVAEFKRWIAEKMSLNFPTEESRDDIAAGAYELVSQADEQSEQQLDNNQRGNNNNSGKSSSKNSKRSHLATGSVNPLESDNRNSNGNRNEGNKELQFFEYLITSLVAGTGIYSIYDMEVAKVYFDVDRNAFKALLNELAFFLLKASFAKSHIKLLLMFLKKCSLIF